MLHWRLLLVTGLVASVTVACGSASDAPNFDPDQGADIESGPEVDETADELATPMWFATADTAACPTGASFDDTAGFCVQGGRALGPFSPAMVSACKSSGGQDCDAANWPLAQAKSLRGQETCPAGTTVDKDLGVCTDGTNVYGPFTQQMVDDCTSLGGGAACTAQRFDRKFVTALPDEEAIIQLEAQGQQLELQGGCDNFNAKLMSYYSSRKGYDAVSRAGVRTLGSRHNGCATWLSHAIRQSGGNMPVETNTENFRDALKSRGWTVIRNRADLRPGDVIITKDRKGRPGHPDHVYMFAGWQGSSPLAVDNQGFTHARGSGKSPIAYGLRAPSRNGGQGCNTNPDQNDAGAPARDVCVGKADGWYCSELATYSAYLCDKQSIAGGWQCGDSTVCRPGSDGKATLSGKNPGCFGSR
jgi:hypothetical protein